MPMFISF